MKSNQFIFVSILIIATATSNIIFANIPNFSPIASVALFSGFYFSNKKNSVNYTCGMYVYIRLFYWFSFLHVGCLPFIYFDCNFGSLHEKSAT